MLPLLWLLISLATVRSVMGGTATTTVTPKNSSTTREAKKSAKLPPCAACKMLTDSFLKGLERTSRGKFDGGDAAWEEKKMGSYKTSEVRLIEIQENLCSEVERGQRQCHAMAEEHEKPMERWWFDGQAESLHSWMCVILLELCCPPHQYGPQCTDCKGLTSTHGPCEGHGTCKGDGTRKGSGACVCKAAYAGVVCSDCSSGYYEAYRDDSKLLCEPCHRACQGPCRGAGGRACLACKEGWQMETEDGCVDVDECVTLGAAACPENNFCVNNAGTHSCLKCDKACLGCHGDGPDMCEACDTGYTLDDSSGICADTKNSDRERSLQFARYVTYAGLTVATCIILQRHTALAALVGVSVAVYITGSEYYLTYYGENGDGAELLPKPITLTSNYAVDD